MKCVLLCFEALLGLRTNLGKSEHGPVGEFPDVDTLALILGCQVQTLLMKYLGLPLEAHFKSRESWNPILVADYLCWHGGSMVWDVSFARPVQDWEVESLTSFLHAINSVKIRWNTVDNIC